MKKSKVIYFAISLFLFLFFSCSIEDDQPGVQEFLVDGLKVILKPTKNEVISVHLFVKGGTANYMKEKEGLELLAFTIAVEGGTKNYPKELLHGKLDKLGSSIGRNSSYDYGVISLRCIVNNWDASWKLFSDVLINPLLEESQFLLLKERLITTAKQSESDPDNYLKNMSLAGLFKGKNYAKNPAGSVESLSALTLEDVGRYYKSLINKQSCFLVVVGNITKSDLSEKVKLLTDFMPEEKINGKEAFQDSVNVINKSTVSYEERDIATNYIRGLMSAPSIGSREYTAMKIAMSILRDRFFVEIRTKRNLSYAPQAYISGLKSPYTVIYVTTTEPNKAVQVMIDEIKKIKHDGFEAKELKNKKGTFLTSYYMNLETNASQSLSLGIAEIQSNWKKAETIVKDVNSLTVDEINSVFDKYTTHIQWVYLGKKNDFEEHIFLQNLE